MELAIIIRQKQGKSKENYNVEKSCHRHDTCRNCGVQQWLCGEGTPSLEQRFPALEKWKVSEHNKPQS